jgi:hypothetical protein
LRSAEITVAIFPWALVLVAFGLLLALLRHARRRRLSQRAVPVRAALEAPPLEPAAVEPAGPAEYEQTGFEPVTYEQAGFDHAGFGPAGFAPVGSEPDTVELAARHDRAETDQGGTYEAEGSEHATPQATSQYPASPPEPAAEPAAFDPAADHGGPTTHEVNPALAGQPAEPPAARVVRPAEMQLRARTQRQPVTADPQPGTAGSGSADTLPADTPPASTPPVPAPGSDSPGGGGYTGDTIPRGELSPAPTSEPPAEATGRGPLPELDRPRSSPTPPSG